METINNISLLLVALVSFSCSTYDEYEFFNFDVVEVDDIPAEKLDVRYVGKSTYPLDMCSIENGYLISYHPQNEHIFVATELNTGQLAGSFCRRGRSHEEMIMSIPISDSFIRDSEFHAWLFSIPDKKLVNWNISKSIKMGIQQYEEIVNLGGRKNESLPFLSVHPLDSAHIVGYNSGQYSERVYRTPAYEIYEVESGVIKDTIKLFNKIELRTGDDVYRSRVFLSVQDCMKPDNSRLACGMFYMPVFNIIDPHTKQVHGIRIKGTKSFSAKNRIVHYMDMAANDDFICALYCGEKLKGKGDYPDYLYLIDWEGKPLHKYILPVGTTSIEIDGNNLYLLNFHTGDISCVELGGDSIVTRNGT